MTVRVITNNVLIGGSAGTTFFSDTFVRAATTSGAGEQYISGPQPGVIEAAGAQVFTNGAALALRATSVNANVRTSLVFWPKSIIPFVRLSQFAECTLVSDNSLTGTANIAGGLFVLAGWQSANLGYRDYGVSWTGADGSGTQNSLRLRRMNGPSTETILQTTASGSAVAGDVLRIEVTVSAGQNDIDVFINGVVLFHLIDANVLRPLEGNPGIGRMLWISGAGPGVRTWTASGFSCGKL